jgi:spermine oxidase
MQGDCSLKEIADSNFNKFLNKLKSKKSLSNQKIEIIKALYNELLKEEGCDNACDLNNLSAKAWANYEDFGDYKTLNHLKNGYGELVDHLSSIIPTDQVILNKAVKKIDWNEENDYVTVTTVDQETEEESVYYGQQCICTMSLGCLKEGHEEIFEPSLPEPKINAIENLGFGILNKVFLVFEDYQFEVILGRLKI